jgi:hypothetical protein
MAKTLTIPWADGNGNIILTYTGQGDGVVTVKSDTDNLGDDRSQTITLRTTGSNPVTAQVTVTQPTGMLTLTVRGVVLRDSQGRPLRVRPQQS